MCINNGIININNAVIRIHRGTFKVCPDMIFAAAGANGNQHLLILDFS